MKSFLGASILALAAASEGGTLKLTWSDCGGSSTHGHITSLTPGTVSLGTKTTLAGKGTIDEAIEGASYKLSAKAGFISLFSHNGDACGPDTIKLPLGLGEINMKGFSCPISPGDVELDLDLTLAASIPPSLAKVAISLTAAATSGDKALCVNINTGPAFSGTADPEWDIIEPAATAGTLKLDWEDCGDASTHTKITDFTPSTLSLGMKTTMAGTGDIDRDISDGATFDLEMTGMLGKLLSCRGDASVTKTCNLPLNIGSLTYGAIPFPIKEGPTTVKVDIQLSAALPAALASTTTIATAVGKSGDKLFCMKIMSSKGDQKNAVSNEWGAACKGSGDIPASSGCYEGKAGALGLTEDIKVDVKSYASGEGTIDLTGSGIEGFTCKEHSFTKSGQQISVDVSDCVPKAIAVSDVKYCSDSDQVKVTVKDKTVPFPISAILSKVACVSNTVVV
jgi:hypothetical protein